MQIEHDLHNHRFVAQTPSGTAELAYRTQGPGVIDLYRTYVPERDREQGFAGRLVEAALRYAEEQEMHVSATCPYVAHWFREHPESANLLR